MEVWQGSPAGPWLAPQTVDFDGDGLRDGAFIAQGVDGCDRADCPLFWIDVLMSRTHTVLRSESSVLLSTDDIEQRTGLSLSTDPTLTWQSRANTGCYEVTASAGKRKLTWTATIESSEIAVKPAVPRAGKPKSCQDAR